MKVLLKGKPGVGKTTIMEKIKDMIDIPVFGFYTREIRENKKRQGFSLISTSGRIEKTLLAHKRLETPDRVGPYGVKSEALNPFIEELEEIMRTKKPGTFLIMIDEIGKMELFNPRFLPLVEKVLKTPGINVIATIMFSSRSETDHLKEIDEVKLIDVTRDNREKLPGEILEEIGGEFNGFGK